MALHTLALGLLTLVDYLRDSLHTWIRVRAEDVTLGRWWEHYRMRDGQDRVGVRLSGVDGVLYWCYRRAHVALTTALPIGRDRWRCLERPGMMVRVLFHREALLPLAKCRGRLLVPPMRWGYASHRVLLTVQRDSRREGHMCTVDAMGRIYDTFRDHHTAVEQQWEEVVRRVQAVLPYIGVGAFVAFPPLNAQFAARGDPQSPPAC